MTPVLHVEGSSEGEPQLSRHYSAAGGVGDVFYEVSWVVVAGNKVTVLKIKLLPDCREERGRILEAEGPNITVLVLLVLHSISCLVGLSLFVDLQIDCLPITYLVVELELGSEYHWVVLVLDFKARHYYYQSAEDYHIA